MRKIILFLFLTMAACVSAQTRPSYLQLKDKPVYDVCEFGAVGDGITDDRAAIQAALDACASTSGGIVVFPAPTSHYSIQSEHPDYAGHGLVIRQHNTTLIGPGYVDRAILKAGDSTSLTSVLAAGVRSDNNGRLGLRLENISIDANNVASHAIYFSNKYVPYLSLDQCLFKNAQAAAAKLTTFVSTIRGCHFDHSNIGLEIASGTNTSINITSCYANGNASYGYKLGVLTYSNLTSCAADGNDIAYYFTNAYGVTMVSCGAESGRQIFKADAARNFSINTFYAWNMGSATATEVPYDFEFDTGWNVTMSGIYRNNHAGSQYALGLTGSSYGSENITILDASISRANTYFVTNFGFADRPIRFLRGDESVKNASVDFSVAETAAGDFANYLSRISFFTLEHTYTITLSTGTHDLGTRDHFIRALSGGGHLIIQGGSSVASETVVDCKYRRLAISNSSAKITFKNLTFSSTLENVGANRLTLTRARDVSFENVRALKTDIKSGSAVALTSSNLYVDSDWYTDSYTAGWATGIFSTSFDSTVTHEKRDAPPSAGGWDDGAIIYASDSIATPEGNIGWICTNAGTPGTWKAFGAIAP
jgi:hypothetical protein